MFPINSEIRRYYWLDFSMQRIIAMPVVLIAILYVMSVSGSAAGTIAGCFSALFMVIVFIWGGYQAANAVIEEVRDNCWDNQRLSSVSPWQLSLGKLFGSTLYSWYGGIITLLVYVFYRLNDQSPILVGYEVLLFIFCAIISHIIALICSIQSLRIQNRYGRFYPIAYLIIGLMATSSLYNMSHDLSKSFESDGAFTAVSWFNLDIDGGIFAITSLLLFLGWGMTGLIRLMREELKFTNIPWVWALFVLFIMIYTAGFHYDTTVHESYPESFYALHHNHFLKQYRLGIAFMFASASIYWMFFADIITITRYRMLCYQWHEKNWRKIGETIPRWMVSFVITIAAAVFFILFQDTAKMGYSAIVLTSYILFILRDAAIVHYFKFSSNNRRATMATLFYYAILYMLLPAISFAVKPYYFSYVFYPVMTHDANIAMLLPVMVQLLAVGYLLYGRWIKGNQEI